MQVDFSSVAFKGTWKCKNRTIVGILAHKPALFAEKGK